MKTNDKKIEDSGYERNIQLIWDMKETAYLETKDLSYSEYIKYVQNDVNALKKRLKKNLVVL